MQFVQLGRSGAKVSRLVLGTMNFGPQTSETDSHAIMDAAVDAGVNFFDTANVYSLGRSEEILGKAMDELAPPVRGMFEAIREACKRRAEELKIKACDVQLTRREIRETTAWSDWQVRMYCQKLVEMEYLWAIQAVNGKPSVYHIGVRSTIEPL